MHCAADGGERFRALGRAELRFRGSGENGAEKNVAGTGALRIEGRLERMAGTADEEAGWRTARGAKTHDVCHGNGFLSEMNAGGAGRESNVQTVVHENFRMRRTSQRSLGKFEKGAAGEILLTNLDGVDTGGRGASDGLEQERGLAGDGGRESVTIRDVEQQWTFS